MRYYDPSNKVWFNPDNTGGFNIKAWNCDNKEKPGIDGESIYIEFNEDLNEGDRITYDFRDGIYLIITRKLDSRCECKIVTNDKRCWLPAHYLSHTTRWFILKTSLGEYSNIS